MATTTTPLLRLTIRPPTTTTTFPLHRPFPHKTLTLTLKPRKTLTTTCSYSATPIAHRLISAAAYTLPLLNGLHYSRFLFAEYPSLAALFEPLFPLISTYRSIPYASFVTFFGIYLGIVRNPGVFADYVRFNAMQALVMDLVLVFPMILTRLFEPGGGGNGVGFKVMVLGFDVLFVGLVCSVVYCWVCCVTGRTPYLPFIGQAASRQV